jgi:hypothetical protein
MTKAWTRSAIERDRPAARTIERAQSALLIVPALHVVERIVEPQGQLNLLGIHGGSPNLPQLVEALVEVLHRVVFPMRLGVPGDQASKQGFIGCGDTQGLPCLPPTVDERRSVGSYR